MRDREIDDRFVMRRLHGDRAEVRRYLRECACCVGEAALLRQPENLASVRERLRIDVDQRHDLDRAVVDVRLQELAAPAPAEDADADVDDALGHGRSDAIATAPAWSAGTTRAATGLRTMP